MVLARLIDQVIRTFPADEKFGLVAQMRLAAVSIPSNIAEGQARKSTAKFVHFTSNAEGSLAELDTQSLLCMNLGFCKKLDVEKALVLIEELKKMLNGLRRALLNKQRAPADS